MLVADVVVVVVVATAKELELDVGRGVSEAHTADVDAVNVAPPMRTAACARYV